MTLLNVRARLETDFATTGEHSLSFWASAELDVGGIVGAARAQGVIDGERYLPHGQVQVASMANLRAAGFELVPTPPPGHYSLMWGDPPPDEDLQRVIDAFDAPIPNPEGRLP
jgi:hypothetical protein